MNVHEAPICVDCRFLDRVEREMARHALGLPNKQRTSYRNHYVTDREGADGRVWMRMVEKGAATVRAGSPLTGGDDFFRLTPAGARAALNSPERLRAEDFPTPMNPQVT